MKGVYFGLQFREAEFVMVEKHAVGVEPVLTVGPREFIFLVLIGSRDTVETGIKPIPGG